MSVFPALSWTRVCLCRQQSLKIQYAENKGISAPYLNTAQEWDKSMASSSGVLRPTLVTSLRMISWKLNRSTGGQWRWFEVWVGITYAKRLQTSRFDQPRLENSGSFLEGCLSGLGGAGQEAMMLEGRGWYSRLKGDGATAAECTPQRILIDSARIVKKSSCCRAAPLCTCRCRPWLKTQSWLCF